VFVPAPEKYGEISIPAATRSTKHASIGGLVEEPVTLFESITAAACFRERGSLIYGVNRARPLARRRLRTRRPALVAMRARNPWVRARLILLGWNVRFIACYLGHKPVKIEPCFWKGGKGTQMATQCQ
jgi:hypothetical protein